MTEKVKICQKEYSSIHIWLRKNHGKANHCENPDCKHKCVIFEWSMIHERGYDYNRDNFRQLCKSCHTKYDYTDERKRKISESQKGISKMSERKWKIKKSNKGKTLSKEDKINRSKKLAEEKKKNMSEWQKGKKDKLSTCPHCGKVGGCRVMIQWHFDNCKKKLKIT